MGYESTWESMVNYFDQNYNATPIAWSNTNYDPQDNLDANGNPKPFTKFNPLPGQSVKKELGRSGIIRHPGVLTLGINVPTGIAEHDARMYADTARSVLEEESIGSNPVIVFKQGWITPNGRSDDGSWYEINTNINYEWDETPA